MTKPVARRVGEKRSWLAKAKSIHDLGGHFYVPNASRPWNEKRDLLSERKSLERMRKPLPVEEAFRPFFGSRMHDSEVVAIERTPAVLRVTVDSIDADIFNYGLADLLDVPRQKGPWPVDLLLHDPRCVRAARYGPRGELRFADWERLLPRPEGRSLSFLYDWFHEDDGRLQWIAELSAWESHRAALSDSVFLMVDCTCATAVDRRRETLVAAFGPAAGLLWDDAWAGVEANPSYPFIWGDDLMFDYLSHRLPARGLTTADFQVADLSG